MASDYTEFCEDELTKSLRFRCPVFQWSRSPQEGISHGDLTTWVDICGKGSKHIILIQFEMYRVAALTNAVKAAYCLEGRPYNDKKVLVLHIFSPFSEKPKRIPEIQDGEFPPAFLRKMKRKDTRATDRRTAYDVRLLCQFLEFKGLLNNEIMTYKVLAWNPVDPSVREATIVRPRDRSQFPPKTSNEIANLAEQIEMAVTEWQKGVTLAH